MELRIDYNFKSEVPNFVRKFFTWMPRRLEYNFKWKCIFVVEKSKKQKEMELRKIHPKWNYRKMKEKTKKQEEKQ